MHLWQVDAASPTGSTVTVFPLTHVSLRCRYLQIRPIQQSCMPLSSSWLQPGRASGHPVLLSHTKPMSGLSALRLTWRRSSLARHPPEQTSSKVSIGRPFAELVPTGGGGGSHTSRTWHCATPHAYAANQQSNMACKLSSILATKQQTARHPALSLLSGCVRRPPPPRPLCASVSQC
jgi:hypothetical protein